MSTALFEVPNLDGLSNDPADLLRAALVFRSLQRYARKKCRAMKARKEGDVNAALKLEDECDKIYQKGLPAWAKW